MDSNTGGLASKKLLLSITSWGLGKGYNGAPVVAPASGTLPILCHLLGSRPDATPGANSQPKRLFWLGCWRREGETREREATPRAGRAGLGEGLGSMSSLGDQQRETSPSRDHLTGSLWIPESVVLNRRKSQSMELYQTELTSRSTIFCLFVQKLLTHSLNLRFFL